MARHARLHDTHHFDVQRARRGIRYDVALAAALEGNTDDGAKYRISRRHADQREAELLAEARMFEREGIRCLALSADLVVDEVDRRALARSRDLLRAAAAARRRQADAIRAAARGVTVVVCANVLVTTYRNAAQGGT